MKIYLTHASSFDFKNQLYQPLLQSQLNQDHQIISDSNLILAEVSHPSTGQGIELGWADSLHKPIICIYQTGSTYSNSLKYLTDTFIEYNNSTDLIDKLTATIASS